MIQSRLLLKILSHLKLDVSIGTKDPNIIYEPLKKQRWRTSTGRIYVDHLRFRNMILNPNRSKRIAMSFIAHEIGHLLVVPHGRRRRKNYGIPDRQVTAKVKFKYELEEAKARILENELLRRLGVRQPSIKLEITEQTRQFTRYHGEPSTSLHTWWNVDGKKMVDELFTEARKQKNV